MKVGMDMDGTLARFHDTFIASYNERFGRAYALGDITDWSKWKIPISLPDFIKMHDEIWTLNWRNIAPAVSSNMLSSLTERYDVDILTHRIADHQSCLTDWLGLNFPNLELNLKIVRSAEEKISSGYDILFDDGNPVAEELIRKKDETDVILFLILQPWNKSHDYGGLCSSIIPVESLGVAITDGFVEAALELRRK
jgi:5'(3')-deoxyribonucleotidase